MMAPRVYELVEADALRLGDDDLTRLVVSVGDELVRRNVAEVEVTVTTADEIPVQAGTQAAAPCYHRQAESERTQRTIGALWTAVAFLSIIVIAFAIVGNVRAGNDARLEQLAREAAR